MIPAPRWDRRSHLLANEPIDRLRREAPLRASFFQDILHPDLPRAILRWLNDPTGQKESSTAESWSAFQSVCQSQYGFDPEADGPISAAAKLGTGSGLWDVVWERYIEAPTTWPNIPHQLRQAKPTTQMTLFQESSQEYWPQDNEDAEEQLREALTDLANLTPGQARKRVLELEAEHGARRDWVWARLGNAPLATALEHLATLARTTEQPVAGATVTDIADDVDGVRLEGGRCGAARDRRQSSTLTTSGPSRRPWSPSTSPGSSSRR